jgi:hypothetical protein
MSRESNRKLFQLPTTGTLSADSEPVSPPRPTRSSFMATWKPVSGRKDICSMFPPAARSTNYVDGYHDLDVGDATGPW